MELVDLMSSKEIFVASIKNVIKTLIEAILLVVLVVYVFPAKFAVYVYSGHFYHRFPCGYFCFSLCRRFQSEYVDVVCTGISYRNGGG